MPIDQISIEKAVKAVIAELDSQISAALDLVGLGADLVLITGDESQNGVLLTFIIIG